MPSPGLHPPNSSRWGAPRGHAGLSTTPAGARAALRIHVPHPHQATPSPAAPRMGTERGRGCGWGELPGEFTQGKQQQDPSTACIRAGGRFGRGEGGNHSTPGGHRAVPPRLCCFPPPRFLWLGMGRARSAGSILPSILPPEHCPHPTPHREEGWGKLRLPGEDRDEAQLPQAQLPQPPAEAYPQPPPVGTGRPAPRAAAGCSHRTPGDPQLPRRAPQTQVLSDSDVGFSPSSLTQKRAGMPKTEPCRSRSRPICALPAGSAPDAAAGAVGNAGAGCGAGGAGGCPQPSRGPRSPPPAARRSAPPAPHRAALRRPREARWGRAAGRGAGEGKGGLPPSPPPLSREETAPPRPWEPPPSPLLHPPAPPGSSIPGGGKRPAGCRPRRRS